MLHSKSIKARNIRVVILAGNRDFERCPLASRRPTALWPVEGVPVLEQVLVGLADQGIPRATICSSGNASLLERSIHANSNLDVTFLDEQLPFGTAGCVRDAIGEQADGIIVVLPANMVCPPGIDVLIAAHKKGKSDLTVMFNPGDGNGNALGEATGIYVCQTSVLKHIPKEGYCDIKEGLIPEMLRAGKTVHAAVLPNHVGNFRTWRGYLRAVADKLELAQEDVKPRKRNDSETPWLSTNSSVHPGARICGPVIIMDGAHVSDGAVVFGPAMLGRQVTVGADSVVVNSVLWDGAKVGPNCEIQRCVIDSNVDVKSNTIVAEQAIPLRSEGLLATLVDGAAMVASKTVNGFQRVLLPLLAGIDERLPGWLLAKARVAAWFAAAFVVIAFLWSYWYGILELWNSWQKTDEYSSGLLVPILAIYVLWLRRSDIAKCPIKPSVLGLYIFVAAQGLRLMGLYLNYSSAENLSIVLSIAALVLLIFGRHIFRKVLTVLLFLLLMLPWPNSVESAVSLPLQRWATSSSVFCLEMVGYEVVQEGNIINIGQTKVAVAEACNGLRMITAFFVISSLVVLLIKRAWWEKLIIFASSLPIAILCNTIRLTITAIAFTIIDGERWATVFHDFGGYAMMPIAIGIVVIEQWILLRLFTPQDQEKMIIVARHAN